MQYLGCYVDDNTRDIAPTATETTIKTPAGCQDVCKGFSYFALQNGNCYCGNKYATQSRYYKVDDSECGELVSGSRMGKLLRNAVFLFLLYIYKLDISPYRL